MSCESGGVKVDHACSGPNSGPMVTSFGFENRPLRLSSLECGLARARCPSNVAPGSPSRSRITGMCDASGASSLQLTSTAHGLAAMISTAASGLGARFTCHDIQPLPDEVEFLAAGLVDHMHVVLVPSCSAEASGSGMDWRASRRTTSSCAVWQLAGSHGRGKSRRYLSAKS
jgi:hypothetical protein